jgi:hypothetical protein
MAMAQAALAETPDSFVGDQLRKALAWGRRVEAPFLHWLPDGLFPRPLVDELAALPITPLELGGVSGQRELHNDARVYFDPAAQARWPGAQAVAEAFQSPRTASAIECVFGADLSGCSLRIEYARDVEGFWLEPHTDIGVKRFTLVYSLSDGPEQDHLGTDIYADPETRVGRSPFKRNAGLVFVPSDRSWHGFEPRPIPGVRKSLIVNYVTPDWRARDQLAFPDAPVRAL